jgi:4-hydroxy 2-oxovalerate aldolase
VNLLDCTLRDGGYYNDWQFGIEFVNNYLDLISNQGIRYCEIGFRTTRDDGSLGVCAFSPETFPEKLKIPKDINLGIMVNASEFVGISNFKLKRIFVDAAESHYNFVRIAANQNELEGSLGLLEQFKLMGYKVFLNLMQIHNLNEENLLRNMNLLEPRTDTLYLADSLGVLHPEDINEIFSRIKSEWKGELGIHAHDNKGLALANTLEAIKSGATWVDSTLLGMGRGPGNTKTEELLIHHLGDLFSPNSAIKIWKFLNSFMIPLREKYQWGSNPLYGLAASKKIHPSFIQTLLNSSQNNIEDTVYALQALSTDSNSKFSMEKLLNASNLDFESKVPGNYPSGIKENSNHVLILANTETTLQNLEYIRDYVERKQPRVIHINTPNERILDIIDDIVMIHPMRLSNFGTVSDKISEKIVIPKSFSDEFFPEVANLNIIKNFEVNLEPGKFDVQKSSCTLPQPLGLLYAVALAISLGASRVTLLGFSGDGLPKEKQKEIIDSFKLIIDNHPTVQFESLFRTFIPVKVISIFQDSLE